MKYKKLIKDAEIARSSRQIKPEFQNINPYKTQDEIEQA
jgi:hypothetical protein